MLTAKCQFCGRRVKGRIGRKIVFIYTHEENQILLVKVAKMKKTTK